MKPLSILSFAFFLLLTPFIYGQQKGYAPINGLKLYYEVYGEGKPIILLHGAFMNINTAFGKLIPELSKNRKVIAMDFQAHGRTADIDRPISLEAFASDVAGLLNYLKIDNADIIGYSLGGAVATKLSIDQPKMVRKLVVLSAPFRSDAWSAETKAIFPQITPEMFEGSPIKAEYDKIAPDPKKWPELVNKIKQSITVQTDLTPALKSVNHPTLIVLGDADGIVTEHAAEMFKLCGGGANGDLQGPQKSELAILPGTSHTGVMMRTEWLLSMIQPFLDK